jgi:hypothetical protein
LVQSSNLLAVPILAQLLDHSDAVWLPDGTFTDNAKLTQPPMLNALRRLTAHRAGTRTVDEANVRQLAEEWLHWWKGWGKRH